MWRKKKDPLLELLGYESDQDFITADDVLKELIRGIAGGNLEMLTEVSGLERFTQADLAAASGIIKGYAADYVRKFFSKSEFHVVEVEENADETMAAVHIKGVTVSGDHLMAQGLAVLNEHESQLQLRAGQVDLRKINGAMLLVGKVIDNLTPLPVTGVVHMEKRDGKWRMVDSEELSQIMLHTSVKEMERTLLRAYGTTLFQRK